MSVLSLPTPEPPAASAPFAKGSRKLAAPARPAGRAALAHHLGIFPLPARTLALVTGNAPGDLPADAALARWVAARLGALSGRLLAAESSAAAFRRDAASLLSLGPEPAPSGEDALVGLAAASRRLASAGLLAEPAAAAFADVLAALPGPETPAAPRKALEDAARGGFPTGLATLVELLGDPDVEDGAVRDAVGRLAAGGTRPGADALAGVVALVRDVALGRS